MGNNFPKILIAIISQNAGNRNVFGIFSENSRRFFKVFEHHRYLIPHTDGFFLFVRVSYSFTLDLDQWFFSLCAPFDSPHWIRL